MRTTTKIIAAAASTLALAGGIGAGLAYADPTSPAPTPSATASPSPTATPTKKPHDQRAKHRLALATALHGEVTLAGDNHRVVVFQRGPVQQASATRLTLKSADGYTATYAISADTRVRKNGEKATAADLKAGDRLLVVATKDGGTLKALRVKAID